MDKFFTLLLIFILKTLFGAPEFVPNAKIVGGSSAHPFQFPFMASIITATTDGGYGQCAGSIISEDYILTAAHCIFR